jgi:hypothetical protein
LPDAEAKPGDGMTIIEGHRRRQMWHGEPLAGMRS